MRYIQTYITPTLTYYYEALLEAFADIDTFIDELIESELGHSFLIAIIIATPVVGLFLFYTILLFPL